jgi:predicted RNA-binding protein with PUA-like domain
MNYWLMKSEPNTYSIDHLKQDKSTVWDGVRNYQARNYLKEMEEGDLAFFYHSNAKPSGIVGMMKVIKTLVNDPTQFDPSSAYYDPKSTQENPRWQTVIVEFVSVFEEIISLETLKQTFTGEDLLLVKKGSRLSVIPVKNEVAQRILNILGVSS